MQNLHTDKPCLMQDIFNVESTGGKWGPVMLQHVRACAIPGLQK